MGTQVERFAEILATEEGGYSFSSLDARLRWVFDGVPTKEKRVLEIGSGDGTFACWCAGVGGAASVTGLEPEADGSHGGVLSDFRTRLTALDLHNAHVAPVTFQEFSAPPASYDVILSYASINHLSEPDCIHLQRDPQSREVYVKLFRKMFDLLAPGGYLLISDCSRHNVFSWVQRRGWLRNPLQRDIEWEKHQPPSVWASLLREAGFVDVSWRWSWLRPLRFLGPLASNVVLAHLTTSLFDLRARRPPLS